MRRAGLLLHPTSLPGPYGIGDLGPIAEALLEWLGTAGLSVWQVLPLGPPGTGGSPYTSPSAFAGNPLLISPDRLVEDGLLRASDVAAPAVEDAAAVDVALVTGWKDALLREAWARFRREGAPALRDALRAFAADPRHA